MKRVCSVIGCERPRVSRSRLCGAHRFRLHKYGDVLASVKIGDSTFRKKQGATFARKCQSCGVGFIAPAPLRKRCDACAVCKNCKKPLKQLHRTFCSRACNGHWCVAHNPLQAVYMRRAQKASQLPANLQRRIKSQTGKPRARGPANKNYKGGDGLRRKTGLIEQHVWRRAVLRRDKWTCQICGDRRDLQAHHIKSWVGYPDLRLIVSNGMSLCRMCHAHVHSHKEFVA